MAMQKQGYTKEKKLTPFQQFEQNTRDTDEMDARPHIGDERRGGSDLDRARRAGLTEAARPGEGPGEDDLAPETLIPEDGALSPFETGSDMPADRTYRVVSADEIGAGVGLDEAELAHVDPLDGEPWDDDEELEGEFDDDDQY